MIDPILLVGVVCLLGWALFAVSSWAAWVALAAQREAEARAAEWAALAAQRLVYAEKLRAMLRARITGQ